MGGIGSDVASSRIGVPGRCYGEKGSVTIRIAWNRSQRQDVVLGHWERGMPGATRAMDGFSLVIIVDNGVALAFAFDAGLLSLSDDTGAHVVSHAVLGSGFVVGKFLGVAAIRVFLGALIVRNFSAVIVVDTVSVDGLDFGAVSLFVGIAAASVVGRDDGGGFSGRHPAVKQLCTAAKCRARRGLRSVARDLGRLRGSGSGGGG